MNNRNIAVGTFLVAALSAGLSLGHAQERKDAAAFQIIEATIDDIHAAFKSGKLTARQLVQGYLDRIAAYDKQGPNINSIITLNDHALEDADRLDAAYRASGPAGPLHGIPILVKDEIDTAGMPTTLGTQVFKNYRPPRDAFAIEKLRKAGAIILGKTTLSEYAAGDTYGSMFGVTRNPYDLERTVGGSSGGSGAALAANFSTVTIGEETFASIRRPAGWNGVASLRPTPGLVSRSGMWDGYPSPTAQMGPMARTVRDLALLLDGMVGYDPEDPVTALGVGMVDGSYARFLDKDGLKGARIGILRESIGVQSEPGSEDFKKVDAVFEQNVSELKAAGAEIVDPVVIPNLKALLARRATNPNNFEAGLKVYLARNPNSPIKSRQDIANSPELAKSFPPAKADRWKNPPPPLDAARYLDYLEAREELMFTVLKAMADNKLDAIVHKTVEHQPTLIKDGINPPYSSNKGVPTWNTFLVYAASMTVPSGFTSDNLPVGITFFGRPYSEPTLLKLAYSYEQATHHRAPPKTTPALR
ncbi:MAG TPA: amidase family protein [Xanthobacteraceae bacterium]|jgi:Asp-tRNA(Asn)/Glu-tRNA(Gln) amidotransferase A subunit family amidase|nr:amidase family protein [Xanthobacteraceae bacterium]